MTVMTEPADVGRVLPRIYAPDIQPRLRAVLAALADIDFAFECDLETIQSSVADEAVKRQAIARLRECHRQRRAPYVRQLAKLEHRIKALAA